MFQRISDSLFTISPYKVATHTHIHAHTPGPPTTYKLVKFARYLCYSGALYKTRLFSHRPKFIFNKHPYMDYLKICAVQWKRINTIGMI